MHWRNLFWQYSRYFINYNNNIIKANTHITRRGWSMVYFKEQLKVTQINKYFVFLYSFWDNNRKQNRLHRCRICSPSKTGWEFDNFLKTFEKLKIKKLIFYSDNWWFNSRSKSWWNEYIASNEGSQFDSLTTTYGITYSKMDQVKFVENSL